MFVEEMDTNPKYFLTVGKDQRLSFGTSDVGQGLALLMGIPGNVTILPDPHEIGLFLHMEANRPFFRQVFPLGILTGIQRFTCCHRYEPFWMTAQAGLRGGEVPVETQFLLVQLGETSFALFVPLVDGSFRCSLQGSGEDSLELVAESGDPAVMAQAVTGLFVAAGDDPYQLVEKSARSVIDWSGTGRLRKEKLLPQFVDQFGWCTWDAFYRQVSHDKVREGLQSFVEGGVSPRLLILDDGWQSVRKFPSGEIRMTAFAANEKFPGDLGPTVRMAKQEFGVETFLVWHAICGYWGGSDEGAFPEYDIRPVKRTSSPGILHYGTGQDEWFGPIIGLIEPRSIYRFFQDFYRHLRLQGVDGVKVDNQSCLESVAEGSGGRVTLMQRYHEALEGSVHTHFKGNLINCMSNSNEMHLCALNSSLTRTSMDFTPQHPESHGRHLYVNAQVGVWFGEFIHPDWDMFQSGHAMGAYHAAARAVSGGPVYVSDKPDGHDFALLRKLVLADGTVLRGRFPGRPTRDCLFHDPTHEDVLLKIFNLNLDVGVLGIFNTRFSENTEGNEIPGFLRPADVEGLAGERFAVYAHFAREVRAMDRQDTWSLSLPQLACEVFTIVPIREGLAPIGLVDMFNSSGAITAKGFVGLPGKDEVYEIHSRGSGRFWVWCEKPPREVWVAGKPAQFQYDPGTSILEFTLPEAEVVQNIQIAV